MASITQAAGEYLSDLLQHNQASDEQCVRLIAEAQQLKLVIGQEQPNDTVLVHNEKRVLALAPEVADQLDEATFDVKQSEQGQTLVLR
jgi:hypothetical protein